jgi:hypothetical protein
MNSVSEVVGVFRIWMMSEARSTFRSRVSCNLSHARWGFAWPNPLLADSIAVVVDEQTVVVAELKIETSGVLRGRPMRIVSVSQSARVVGRENERGAVLDVEHDVITAGAGVDADIWFLFDYRNPAQICTMTKGR